jgi:hypothetical protein
VCIEKKNARRVLSISLQEILRIELFEKLSSTRSVRIRACLKFLRSEGIVQGVRSE